MTELLIVRHGETLGNIQGLFIGHTDMELSEIGKKQAQLLADRLENENIDVIYSSDLKRAVQTIEPYARRTGKDIQLCKNLREIHGGKWENVPFSELPIRFPDTYTRWISDIGLVRCDDGESTMELKTRVLDTIYDIARKNDGKKVLIATHAIPIKMLYIYLNQIPSSQWYQVSWVKNASITQLIFDHGQWNMITWDATDHLSSLETAFPSHV
ncbi:MAG TPA: hypothetical protein DCY74_05200 [Clostridiales bacterium]|jgi:probable phosphoglycerate mutase|nr:hypothetical protein [Clostridiales bacterium]